MKTDLLKLSETINRLPPTQLADLLDLMSGGILARANQGLVENAIKHNVTSKEAPLKIEILSDTEFLTVSNNLNLRSSSYSTKTGLRNLVKRYEMLTSKDIVVQYDEERFEVKIPMF